MGPFKLGFFILLLCFQMLSHGSYKSAEEICSNVDAIKLTDVQKVRCGFASCRFALNLFLLSVTKDVH